MCDKNSVDHTFKYLSRDFSSMESLSILGLFYSAKNLDLSFFTQEFNLPSTREAYPNSLRHNFGLLYSIQYYNENFPLPCLGYSRISFVE